MAKKKRPALEATGGLAVGEATGSVTLVAVLLLVMSGIAGLVYQLLWVKQLSLVVGADVFAVTTAVSAFFAGLAIGSYGFGKRADRLARPLHLYAFVEIGIGVLGVLATLLISQSAPWFVWLETHTGPAAWALPFVLVGLPAVLMGGTVPLMMRVVAPAATRVAAVGGHLYAANTAGAILGVLLAPFLLIPLFGVLGSAFVAAAINVAVALIALFVARSREARVSVQTASALPEASRRNRLALGLYSIIGGLALGYEVIWSQAIVQWTSTRRAMDEHPQFCLRGRSGHLPGWNRARQRLVCAPRGSNHRSVGEFGATHRGSRAFRLGGNSFCRPLALILPGQGSDLDVPPDAAGISGHGRAIRGRGGLDCARSHFSAGRGLPSGAAFDCRTRQFRSGHGESARAEYARRHCRHSAGGVRPRSQAWLGT